MATQLIRSVQCLDAHNSFVPVVYRFQLTVLLYFTLVGEFRWSRSTAGTRAYFLILATSRLLMKP